MQPTRSICLIAALTLFLVSCTKDDDFKENEVPVVDAGSSKSITLPVNSETLTGTATDNDGKVVAYLWSQVSGPSVVKIVSPGSASTLIQDFKEGSYIFQLMATDDKGATGVDTARVTVNPAVEKTLTLQPANNPGEFELSLYNGQDQSQSGAPDIPLAAWTKGGLPLTFRHLIKFDLSTIPANATIISANLSLYSYPTPTLNGNFVNANFGANNAFLVQQAVSNWAPASTTWFNQPAGSATNQLIVPTTAQSQLDVTLDVKNIISSMVSTNANYGFLLKLQTEAALTSRQFVSSFTTAHPDKRPKLVVVYK